MLDRFPNWTPHGGAEAADRRSSRIVLYAWWTPAEPVPEAASFQAPGPANGEVDCTPFLPRAVATPA